MLQIPPEALSPDVLTALIEEFVTRHGTDLADADAKIAQVRRQLKTGQIVISWDEKTQSANIVPKDAKEEPPPAEPRGTRRDDSQEPPAFGRRTGYDDEGRQIVYDEPTPPDDF